MESRSDHIGERNPADSSVLVKIFSQVTIISRFFSVKYNQKGITMIRFCQKLCYMTLLYISISCTWVFGDVYKIKKGDNLLIAVIGQPEYTQTIQVRDDGRISYFGGDIKVSGKSTDEINKLIIDFLQNEGHVNKPIIMVSPVLHENGVIVGGAVENPGLYTISPDSSTDLYRAIALAGGFTENADVQQVQLIRYNFGTSQANQLRQESSNEETQPLYPSKIETYNLSISQPYRDIKVHAKDLVYVLPLSVIEVQGEVKVPGKLFIRDNISITNALARVGGLTEEADMHSLVIVKTDGTHNVLSISEQYWMSTKQNENEISLSDGELLFVPNAIKVERIFITGYVQTPGAQRVKGPLTIQKAIALAGGFEDEANTKKMFIHRIDGSTTEHIYKIGVDSTLLYPGDTLEVKKRFQLNWGLISTISSTAIAITYFIVNLTQN